MIPSETPVSRAYYKLDQVFDDRDNLQMISCRHGSECSIDMLLSHGAGIDIGAAPGGWTQVMHSKLKIPSIVAVDPGILAKRVSTLPGVHHVRNDISSNETINFLATHAPFSLIVCDACVDVAVLFEKILQSLEGVSSLLKSPNQVFSWPLCLVVTLKFPYKTTGSIDRHMDRARRAISDFLRKLITLSCDDEIDASDTEAKYMICHLFANSVAERCLIAVFNRKNNEYTKLRGI
jgi:23S rRNA U2552 (ribose-2'-O)-methylase RlmE/FtsJ